MPMRSAIRSRCMEVKEFAGILATRMREKKDDENDIRTGSEGAAQIERPA